MPERQQGFSDTTGCPTFLDASRCPRRQPTPSGAWCEHASPCRAARRRRSPDGAWSRGLDLPHQPEAFAAQVQALRVSRSGKKPDAKRKKAQNSEKGQEQQNDKGIRRKHTRSL
ncbi:hypothetical protein VPH35_102453 [Triticum aestivum]